MVRANRPWLLFLGLPRALTATIATAAIAMMNATVWQIGDTLGAGRLWLLAFGSVIAAVAWLMVIHRLWERTRGQGSAQEMGLVNAVTVLTLALGVLCLYVATLVVALVVAELFIDADLLSAKLQHSVGLGDYVKLAWVVSSTATIGAALGAGLDDRRAVRDGARGAHNGSADRAAADPLGSPRA
jgi:hypothetical protein